MKDRSMEVLRRSVSFRRGTLEKARRLARSHYNGNVSALLNAAVLVLIRDYARMKPHEGVRL